VGGGRELAASRLGVLKEVTLVLPNKATISRSRGRVRENTGICVGHQIEARVATQNASRWSDESRDATGSPLRSADW
jgi:hypothetical protein